MRSPCTHSEQDRHTANGLDAGLQTPPSGCYSPHFSSSATHRPSAGNHKAAWSSGWVCEEGSKEGSRDLCKPAFCRPGTTCVEVCWHNPGGDRGWRKNCLPLVFPLGCSAPLSPKLQHRHRDSSLLHILLNQQQKRGRAGDRAKLGPTKVSLRLSCSYLF